MEPYQREFVDLLVRYDVVRFGDFTLKSGRKSPYFVNAGQLRTGGAIAGVGRAYAAALERAKLVPDLIFGPAYKGVPLAVSTAMGMCEYDLDVPYGFDRKEAKDHGEGGVFVGTAPADGMKIVLVDDVITSGKSLREAVDLLRNAADVDVTAAVVAVDRMERGRGEKTTLAELRDDLGIEVHAIVTIEALVDNLHGREVDGRVVLGDAQKDAITSYLAENAGQA